MAKKILSFTIMISTLAFVITGTVEGSERDSLEVQKLRQQVVEFQLEIARIEQRHAEEMAVLNEKMARLFRIAGITTEGGSEATGLDGPTETAKNLSGSTEPISAMTAENLQSYQQGRIYQSFNPDIGVITDFLSSYSSNGKSSSTENRMREVEIGMSGAVDTLGRYNLFLALRQEGNTGAESGELVVEVEEGYYTFNTLPHDLQLKVGKFRNSIGKVNAFHEHVVPWVAYPLVVQNFLGEEGLAGTGASLSWLVPNPWDTYMELTYELFDAKGEDSTLFFDPEAEGLSNLLKFKYFHDVTDTSSLEIGLTSALSPSSNEFDDSGNWLSALDFTYRWRPFEQGRYRSFDWRSELFSIRKNRFDAGARETFRGVFSSVDYQFGQRWMVGLRYDYAEGPLSAAMHERDLSAYLTFLQSEFGFWRLGYLRRDPNYGSAASGGDNRLFLQFTAMYGPHPTHKY